MLSDKETAYRNMLVVIDSKVLFDKLEKSLPFLKSQPSSLHRFRNVDEAIEHIDQMIVDRKSIDIIISDVYFHSSERNILALINKLEQYIVFRNTPLLVFTNEKDSGVLSSLYKAGVHLPMRILFTEAKNEEILGVFNDLVHYKAENHEVLDLEAKIDSAIEMGNRHLLPSLFAAIQTLLNRKLAAFTSSQAEFLKGKLSYHFWLISNKRLSQLEDKLSRAADGSPEYLSALAELDREGQENADFLESAEVALEAGHKGNWKNWKIIELLYHMNLDRLEYDAARKYLMLLIQLFPDESINYLRMGRLEEIMNNYTDSVGNYMEAMQKALDNGVANVRVEHLVEIVDASLVVGKQVMQRLGISSLRESTKIESDSLLTSLKGMRKNNAQLRVVLEKMSSRAPDDAMFLNKIAITYRRTGEYNLAERFYVKALQIEPKNVVITINYAMCLACDDLFERAAEIIAEVDSSLLPKDEREMLSKARELLDARDISQIRRMML